MHSDITRAVYTQFGKQLREVRTGIGLTQQELASIVGMSRPSISNIEAGRQHIQLEVVYRLAHALGVAIENLLPDLDFEHSVPGLDGLPDSDEQFVESIIRGAEAQLRGSADA